MTAGGLKKAADGGIVRGIIIFLGGFVRLESFTTVKNCPSSPHPLTPVFHPKHKDWGDTAARIRSVYFFSIDKPK